MNAPRFQPGKDMNASTPQQANLPQLTAPGSAAVISRPPFWCLMRRQRVRCSTDTSE
jgi:hypothetical protein